MKSTGRINIAGLAVADERVLVNEKFGFSLTKTEVDDFLARIGLKSQIKPPTYTFLAQVLTAVLEIIPFHNLTLLTRGRRVPTTDEIKKDLLSGLGGPCGHINPFLGALLECLGFEVHLVSGSMMEPNCHLALLVHLPEGRYYCDCGDGRPYFYPMPISEFKTYNHPSLTWRTYPLGKKHFALDVKPPGKNWKRNCTVDLKPRSFAFFKKFIACHYTTDSYGPFQNGFRLFWYPDQKVVGLRDLLFISQEENKLLQTNIHDAEAFTSILRSYFPIPVSLAQQACSVLSARGVKPFNNIFP